MKKTLRFIVTAVMILSFTASAYAQTIPFDDAEDKALYAGYELFDIIYMLSQEYVGEDITVEELFDAAVQGITSVLDQYSVYMSEEDFNSYIGDMSGDIMGIGVGIDYNSESKVRVVNVYENGPAEAAGIIKGDILISINSTEVESINHAIELIQNSVSTEMEIVIERNGKTQPLKVTKDHVTVHTVYAYGIEDIFEITPDYDNSKIGYLDITSFYENTANEFAEGIEKLTKNGVEYLILDLRDNGGGYLTSVMEISQLIVPKGPTFYTITKDGNKEVVNSDLSVSPFKHIVILVNENTASASELLASALQDSGIATVIGQQSYGKGLIQFMYGTITGGGLKYTGAEYLRRNGEKLNNIGITPDICIERPDFILPITLDPSGKAPGVVGLKNILSYLGFDITDETTYLDENTKEQIKEFQELFEAEITGNPDDATVELLNEVLYAFYTFADKELEAAYEYLIDNYFK